MSEKGSDFITSLNKFIALLVDCLSCGDRCLTSFHCWMFPLTIVLFLAAGAGV